MYDKNRGQLLVCDWFLVSLIVQTKDQLIYENRRRICHFVALFVWTDSL